MHQGSQGTRRIDREAVQAERMIVLFGENNTSLWSDPRKCRRQNQLSAIEVLPRAAPKGLRERALLRNLCLPGTSGQHIDVGALQCQTEDGGNVPRVQPPCIAGAFLKLNSLALGEMSPQIPDFEKSQFAFSYHHLFTFHRSHKAELQQAVQGKEK